MGLFIFRAPIENINEMKKSPGPFRNRGYLKL